MIQFKCEKCHKPLTAPKGSAGKKYHCLGCDHHGIVPNPAAKDIRNKTLSGIEKLFSKSPRAFRTGFLTTLGVCTALLCFLWVYGHVLIPSKKDNPQQSSSIFSASKPADSLESCKAYLEKQGLFFTSSQAGILRARQLLEFQFRPDANFDKPHLSIWTDDAGSICGISARWGDWDDNSDVGAYMKKNCASHYSNMLVYKTFEQMVSSKSNKLKIASLKFVPSDNGSINSKEEVALTFIDPWSIQVDYSDVTKGENYITSYIATAQNW